ncbi:MULTISPECIES: hypothetical protein [Rhodococcus]|uniref:hypothetical protein n=1 Tax=Rhodococcus TaxID=1827 RepID=UPI001C5E9FDA|nr:MULTISPECIES: hypothetical protein [Rhodococcus]MBW4815950.1 hypothetical protein [Rhodococcus qingshengii]MCZ9629558.1 hypothetical protein [Rhodococcus sp. BH5]MEA1796605.1 hypothetical protein [Rhodococcus qingshengii]
MTEPTSSQDTRVVAAMRLSGARFNAPGIPAESLVEISALEDIMRSLVKLYWHDSYPNKKRMPKGYDDRIALRLVQKIGEGSCRATLEYDLGPGKIAIDEEDEIEQYYDRALNTVDEFIAFALSDEGQLPVDMRRLPPNKVKRLGHTLHTGDTIQVAPTDVVEWKGRPEYTTTARSNAIDSLDVETRKPATVKGQVIDFHVLSGKLTVRDRDHKRDITVPYRESGVTVEIASAQQLFECEAEGIGEFNADGRLTKLATVTTLNVVDVTEDARAARAAVDSLADLDEGWLDGECGEPITAAVIERGRAVIDAMISLSNITRVVFPTEPGGIRFFWPEVENQLSIEVEPSGALYVHATDLRAGTFAEDNVAPDVVDLVAALDSWLSEASS